MKDYYAILGVDPTATANDIKSAYRKKAALYHPDRNPAPDAAAKFREVQQSYDVLAEPAKRHDYDENRRRSLLDNPAHTAGELWNTYIDGILS
jgi:DnaJ-class molecular chaperone